VREGRYRCASGRASTRIGELVPSTNAQSS
jgi:hypothetical protein